MSSGNTLRRGQLIAPFGIGALTVAKDGTSMICAGLDRWFEVSEKHKDKLVVDEFQFEEWRLQRRLQVSHFRLPPDFRQARKWQDIPNTNLIVPFFRFPLWHYCPRCNYLFELPTTHQGYYFCTKCQMINKRIKVSQVPIVAVCDHGHLQDFPWREWVHKTTSPECKKDMKLRNYGGAGLTDLFVECDCGKRRTLKRITSGSGEGSTLSDQLSENRTPFLCQGTRPWFGQSYEICNRPILGTPRNATNLYFAKTMSALYLPEDNDSPNAELIEVLRKPPLSTLINALRDTSPTTLTPKFLRGNQEFLLQPYSDKEVDDALNILLKTGDKKQETNPILDNEDEATEELNFRYEEYNVVRQSQSKDELLIRQADLTDFSELFELFSTINLVHKLRETRVLTGFTRCSPEVPGLDAKSRREKLQSLLWEQLPPYLQRWLPAIKVYGEGIFIEFSETRLKRWENLPEVVARVRAVEQRNKDLTNGYSKDGDITPRFMLLHTFSHLLMTQMTFASGYSAASLRERLFVSQEKNWRMAALLIYTAAGDSEGTLGGLVRLGKPKYLDVLVKQVINAARWCASDPVCMEVGDTGGQGPGSLNLAACHSCALVPETSCEEFNRFLDRALLVGTIENPNIGYFTFDSSGG